MGNIQEYFNKYTNSKYLSKQELMYRVQNNKQDFAQVWEQTIVMRRQKSIELPLHDSDGESFWYMTPPFLLKKMNQIDSIAKRQLEEIASMEIHKELLFESMFNEAFYSSVIEGAFSTKKRAKEVVKNKDPRDKSEQMIMNNYLGMMYVLENMNRNIDQESILTLHKILTKDTLSDEDITEKYRTGAVYVKSDLGEIIYEAPNAEHVESMMKNLIQFIHEEDDAHFIHPMIKASIIHFYMGFIHPFFDGNGRVARALAYMYLLKHGYDFFKFFSISNIISKHRKKYYQSYLFSEEPERDLTYFIVTQIEMTQESIEEVINRLSSIYNQELLNDRLAKDYVILSKRQNKFLNDMNRKDSNLITVKDYEKQFKVAYETARTDLNELDGLGLVRKIKKGKKYIYIFQGIKGYMENHEEHDGQHPI